jgi:hypothetical protein
MRLAQWKAIREETSEPDQSKESVEEFYDYRLYICHQDESLDDGKSLKKASELFEGR